MPGFYLGGYEAAKRILEDEYRSTIRELCEKLKGTSFDKRAERNQLNAEIARCKEEFRNARASLDRSLY